MTDLKFTTAESFMSNVITGVSEGFHNAAITQLEDTEIVFATSSERYSRKKNEKYLTGYLAETYLEGTTAFYENTELKNARRYHCGQTPTKNRFEYDHYFHHHESHAAAGYYTAPFDDCNILVIDAIGEWDTVSIWDNMTKVKSWSYPYSLGLLYSAITARIGLTPNEDEYITMGMAAYGEPIYDLEFLLEENNHQGVGNIFPHAKNEDLAASVQALYEKKLLELVDMCPKKNLVIMGGCALNCLANSKIQGKNIWIMPAPDDSGSSLGAAALVQKKKLNWQHPYLGHNIDREVNPKEVVDYLTKRGVCGIANGRAEFGPRALGNRSLIADPRLDIKDTVNDIKQRQRFRPFAPAILEEYADEYFDGPMNRYMQFVANAKHDYKSVTHVDGTARVQIVEKECVSVIRPILEEWYEATGCPMLLNTSLNIKGEPIVNDLQDAKRFEEKHNVRVF